MIRKTLLFLLLFFTVFLTEAQDASIRQAIVQQVETYPASTLKDIYKNFFQDAFGPGHLMSNASRNLAINSQIRRRIPQPS